MNEKPRPKKEIEELGYDIVYKPHKEVVDHMAFYKVEYEGEVIAPPIVEKYDISLNEIWLSEKFKPYERYILYHELQEIKYRAEGYGVKKAHLKAKEDEKIWERDSKWEELRREINLVGRDFLTDISGFGDELFDRLMKNRPYFDMDELKYVKGIGEKRFNILKEEFWCFGD